MDNEYSFNSENIMIHNKKKSDNYNTNTFRIFNLTEESNTTPVTINKS